MIYLLDTNTCIQYLNGRSQTIKQRLRDTLPSQIKLCAIVKAELLYGVMKSARVDRNLAALQEFVSRFESFPFDDSAVESYARIRLHLEKAGTPIGPNDLLIASTAVTYAAVLITHNTREFKRVPGLNFEDWEANIPG